MPSRTAWPRGSRPLAAFPHSIPLPPSSPSARPSSSIRRMIEASRKVIVVADRTKFGRDGMLHVADLKELDVVVSDSCLAPEYQELLKDNGLTCILA